MGNHLPLTNMKRWFEHEKFRSAFQRDQEAIPKTMSKDQLYRVAHISKATALYLLQSGAIPCKDTGKKHVAIPLRQTMWSSTCVRGKYARKSTRPVKDGTQGQQVLKSNSSKLLDNADSWADETVWAVFEAEMKEMADLITIEELAVFAGYKSTSVVNWCSSKRWRHLRLEGNILSPKSVLSNI